MTEATALADSIEQTLGPLALEANRAFWDANVDASEENERRQAETLLAYSSTLGDAELFADVDAARRNGRHDRLVARRLGLLHDLMLPRQVPAAVRERIVELETSVSVRFSRHRGVIGDEEVDDVTIGRILRESDDSDERREAWEASKTVGAAVADDVRELARLRNEAARSLGHRDWYGLSVAVSELDEGKLLETLTAAGRATAKPFTLWKARLDTRLAERFGCAPSDLRPWHYADPFFQEAPTEGSVDLDPLFREQDIVALGQRTFDGIGIDVAGIVARSDLFPRAGKCQHAFCMDVDRDGDVRVLMNATDNHESMEVMLHELGHGVYDLGIDSDLAWLLRDTHLVTTEASALLFGALASEKEWLVHVLGLADGEATELEGRLHAARAAELLVFSRWVLVMTDFERRLYADPDGDLDAVWWELVSKHQLVTPPADRHAPDWAAKYHVALAPVYYHTYLYGAIVAAQIRDALGAEVGGIVDRREAGGLLGERLYSAGLAARWDHLVEQVSGKPLSVASLAREVAAAN